MRGSVDMRPKLDAFFADLAQVGKAEYLEAAGVREYRAWPRHETVKAAHARNRFVPRPQIKVIGIGQQDAHAQLIRQIALRKPFYRGLRPHRHKRRGFHDAVRGFQKAGARPRFPALGHNFKSSHLYTK